MHLKISTQVDQHFLQVKDGFTATLFKALNPPFPLVKLHRFDGCLTHDQVWIELNFILFKQHWHALIIQHELTEQHFYFIDQGLKLPFFLKTWQHKHILKHQTDGTLIIDQIEYTTGTLLSDWLMYPLLYLQFLYRKPIYRTFFSKAL